jgi:hypothetical protein
MRPRTLSDDNEEMIWAIASHRGLPIPLSVALRTSSSKMISLTTVSSLHTSPQIYLWIVDAIWKRFNDHILQSRNVRTAG